MSMNEITHTTKPASPHLSQPDDLHAHWRSKPTIALGRMVVQIVPNLLVVFALAGLACWGYETGWRLPRFAELTATTGADADDWCAEHAVRESICVECDDGLLPRGKVYGWCKVHGVHE